MLPGRHNVNAGPEKTNLLNADFAVAEVSRQPNSPFFSVSIQKKCGMPAMLFDFASSLCGVVGKVEFRKYDMEY
jgi:hypothetical protein